MSHPQVLLEPLERLIVLTFQGSRDHLTVDVLDLEYGLWFCFVYLNFAAIFRCLAIYGYMAGGSELLNFS